MSFMRIFKSNPMDLIGPNLQKAPIKTIGLSGNRLSFICPPASMTSTYISSSNFDIDRDPQVEIYDSNSASARIFSSGWEFVDKPLSGLNYGGVTLDIILLKNLHAQQSGSLLINDIFQDWSLKSNIIRFSTLNNKKHKRRDDVVPERDYWQYPKTGDDLEWLEINGRTWMKYETFLPGSAPYVEYETALTNQHVILASWSASAFHGIDFFSNRHNLIEATTKLMEDIMATMRIELSPETRKQYEEAGVPVP